MNHSPRVVAISGSLRDRSTTRTALRHALAATAAEGGRTDLPVSASTTCPLTFPLTATPATLPKCAARSARRTP